MTQTTQNEPLLHDDAELAARALADPTAFATLFDRYFPLIHKYALYRVGDLTIADDLTSEVFEALLNALPRYKPGKAPFGAWLFGIARHAVNDHHRNQKNKREVPSEFMDLLFANDPLPEEVSLNLEAEQRLLTALKQLSSREKDIIALKFAANLTNRQIAKLTTIGESNVGVILYRSMQRLRQLLYEMEKNDER
ncbi:MAG: sigma-70 family RNA polymerase sigma factor [Anaerolineaceae bacterium]|nr:sigma-70 family RNA polymerase sigma factor [Anaerolineaceae bacterium]